MKVRLLVGRAGPGLSQAPGDIIEVGDGEGVRMILAGQAEAVAREPEKAVRIARTERATRK